MACNAGAKQHAEAAKDAESNASTPHHQTDTASTKHRAFFLDQDGVLFLSEREKAKRGMDASSAAQTDLQMVIDDLGKCYHDSPKRCIGLLNFFIRNSVQPSEGDYVSLPESVGRGIGRVKIKDLSGVRFCGCIYLGFCTYF